MYHYPLRFKLNGDYPGEDLSILDSRKNEVLFRPKQPEQTESFEQPAVIFSEKDRLQPQFHYLTQLIDGKRDILISTAGDLKLGRVIEGNGHEWQILDAKDLPFGEIREKCTYKGSCLFALLTLTVWEALAKIFFPHRYEVRLRGVKVLVLRESDDTLIDDYFLKKKGEFNEREESLLVAGLISVMAAD